MLVRDDCAKYSSGAYNESAFVLVVGVVVDCLVNRLKAGGKDGSGSVSRVLRSISGLFELLSVAAPTIRWNVTFLAALVAFDAGLNLLRALSGRFYLSFYERLSCRISVSG